MAAATGALPSRAARFRDEPHVGVVLASRRISRVVRDGPRDRRAGAGGGGARRAGVSRRHRGARRRDRHRRRPRADRRRSRSRATAMRSTWPTAPSRRSASTACSSGRDIGRKALAAHAAHDPARSHEVRGRHLRLPRQPGRLARDRRRAARARRRRRRARARPTWSSSTPARSPAPPIRARGRRSAASRAINPVGADRRHRLLRDAAPGEVAALPNVVRVVPNPRQGTAGDASSPMRSASRPAARFAGGDGPCGAPLRARGRRAHGVDAARADRLRRALQLLHHSEHARRGPVAAARRRSAPRSTRRGRGLQGDRPDRRAPRLVRARPGRRLVARGARAACSPTGRPTCCFASARSSRWTARRRSSSWSRPRRGSRRTSICRCSTGRTRCCAAMRRPYTAAHYRGAGRSDSRAACRTPRSASDVIVGFPGETDAQVDDAASAACERLAAHAPARVSLLGSAGHRGQRA